VNLIFIVAVAAIICSVMMIGFAILKPTDNSIHSIHLIEKRDFDSIQLANVDHANRVIREGDARELSDLKINNQTLDPDNNCEFCTEIIYNPGKQKVAGIAYQINKTDLSLSKRIVFFAKGQNGGEQVSFVAVGRNIGNDSQAIDNLARAYFPNQRFGIMTEKITLSDYWKRYEISLISKDLTEITYPFGFVLTSGNTTGVQKFFLKGITFDDKYASDDISAVS
jgi:hypothetical protein